MKLIFSLLLSAYFIFASAPTLTNHNTTAVILDLNTSNRTMLNEQRANERLNPCSTFKILNSMISLDAKVIKDENETIKWDGTVREYPSWNRDHNMLSAISVSAVWFYQELAHRVGTQRMQDGVKAAQYGNMDTSKTPNDFWLCGGSLKISANEQVEFLAKLAKNELPFSKRAMDITKDIITLEKKDGLTLIVKTGSCGGVGWFVGIVDKNGSTKVFAFNTKGDGAKAKEMALKYLFENRF